MAIEVEIRKWGNSVGVILPKNFADKEKLKEKDKVVIHLVKKSDISDTFGTLKTKTSGQEFKNMVRKGWKKN